jgi:hypothetical protein
MADPPPKGGIIFTGSSSIRMWTSLKEDFPGLPVLNRGFGGSMIPEVTPSSTASSSAQAAAGGALLRR